MESTPKVKYCTLFRGHYGGAVAGICAAEIKTLRKQIYHGTHRHSLMTQPSDMRRSCWNLGCIAGDMQF
jgi:hypothetical protein